MLHENCTGSKVCPVAFQKYIEVNDETVGADHMCDFLALTPCSLNTAYSCLSATRNQCVCCYTEPSHQIWSCPPLTKIYEERVLPAHKWIIDVEYKQKNKEKNPPFIHFLYNKEKIVNYLWRHGTRSRKIFFPLQLVPKVTYGYL